jgi:hypothetical protein
LEIDGSRGICYGLVESLKEHGKGKSWLSSYIVVYDMGAFQNKFRMVVKIKQESVYQFLVSKYNRRGLEMESV